MATVQTAPRKTLSLPKNAANTRAALAAGEKAPRIRTQRKTVDNVWVAALVEAGAFHRDALQVELAVGLSLYAAKGEVDKAGLPAKKELRAVYEAAGYACKTPVGADYKTVQRRIGVTADLYQFLGGRQTVIDWTDDTAVTKQVETIVTELKKYKFNTVTDVQAFVGKAVPVKRQRKLTEQPAAQQPENMSEADRLAMEATAKLIEEQRLASQEGHRRAVDKLPAGRIISAGAVTCPVPQEASYEDVMAVAERLIEFARSFMVPAVQVTKELVAAA